MKIEMDIESRRDINNPDYYEYDIQITNFELLKREIQEKVINQLEDIKGGNKR